MKKRLLFWLVLFVAALAMSWNYYQDQNSSASLGTQFPRGALLYLEARDFGSLVRDWNASPEKQAWLKSDNYSVFSRSRLFLRLQSAQREFAAAAGLSPNLDFLQQVAGERSALAIYDIGKLEFLYITRMPSAGAIRTALWQKRTSFEPRKAAGQDYFVKTDPQSGRVVAFALTDNSLLLATREDLLANSLAQLAAKPGNALPSEAWFDQAQLAAGKPGDLRLLLNMATLVKTPQFRTYWIQQNITDLGQYTAASSDLFREGDAYREVRLLIRSEKAAASHAPAQPQDSLATLQSLVPADAGLYRAWHSPLAATVRDLLEHKFLQPRVTSAPAGKEAPAAALFGGEVGSEGDLETRIDEPAAPLAAASVPDPLLAWLQNANLRGALQIQSTNPSADGVFISTRSTLMLLGEKDWDSAEARERLQARMQDLLTTSRIGLQWTAQRSGRGAYFQIDGLAPLSLLVKGRYLVISNSPVALTALMSRLDTAGESGAATSDVYAAGFRHSLEQEKFARMSSLIDRPANQFNTLGLTGHDNAEPAFFSQNIASLSHALQRVQSESILVRDDGKSVSQTVTYQWK